MKLPKLSKATWSWCMYDWANSAFSLCVITSFFPGFFKSVWSTGVDVSISTARLGFANSCAGICIALVSPLVGACAGIRNSKKLFLVSFIVLGTFATASLAIVDKGDWEMALILYVAALIGFWLANVLYDSLLLDVTEKIYSDAVSSIGYSMGYLGSSILFVAALLMYAKSWEFFHHGLEFSVRLVFFIVALWWILFSLPLVVFVREKKKSVCQSTKPLFREVFSGFLHTAKQIFQSKQLTIFIIAYWFYFDGVNTFIVMATDYGLSLGLKLDKLLVAILMVNLIGGPSTLLFVWIAKKIGSRNCILLSITVYFFITLASAALMRNEIHFFIVACCVGVFQGGIQALSRSLFAVMTPVDKQAEYFGFFNMVGKCATIVGPGLVATITILFRFIGVHSPLIPRISISSVALFFVVGAFCMFFVKQPLSEERSL